jgi:hypothetical protein
VAHDINCLLTGNAQGVNLTLNILDETRLSRGKIRKERGDEKERREKMNESLGAAERQSWTKAY